MIRRPARGQPEGEKGGAKKAVKIIFAPSYRQLGGKGKKTCVTFQRKSELEPGRRLVEKHSSSEKNYYFVGLVVKIFI